MEAYLIETLALTSRSFGVAAKVQFSMGDKSPLLPAIEKGLRVAAETTGAGLRGLLTIIEMNKTNGYVIKAFNLLKTGPEICIFPVMFLFTGTCFCSHRFCVGLFWYGIVKVPRHISNSYNQLFLFECTLVQC